MNRMPVLIGVAGLAIGGALVFRVWLDRATVTAPKRLTGARPVDLAALTPIFEAEKIVDPMQRCLTYPSLPGAHWSRKLIETLCADKMTPRMTWDDFESAIEGGAVSELDARLDALIEGYFAQRVPEATLQHTYDAFEPTPRVEGLVRRWLEQAPNSAHALAARGTYELSMAKEARGEDVIGRTPRRDLERMQRWLEKARSDFERALSANPRIMGAYSSLIQVARLTDDDDLADEAIGKANAVDPSNYFPRGALAAKYEPRWGGSFARMDRLAASAEAMTERNPRLINLRAMALAERGMPAYFAHDYAAALKHFDAGLAEGPVAAYLERAAYAADQIHDTVKAVELSSQLVRFFPTDTGVRADRAYRLNTLGRFDWAEADLRAVLEEDPTNAKVLRSYADLLIKRGDNVAAEYKLKELLVLDPKDNWSTGSLAWLYAHRLHRLDDALALIDGRLKDQPESGELWLMRVRAFDGVDEGPRMRETVETFLRYADPHIDDQRNAVAIARRWLAAHPFGGPAATP